MSRLLIRVALALALAANGVALSSGAPARAAGMLVERLAGADRYATAAAVSAAHFAVASPVAYIAAGENYPDALAAGPVAALAGAPILLVSREAIPAATDAELRRLQPGRIVVLGLGSAVADGVVAALEAYHTGGGVSRLGGADRYETAAAVSAAHFLTPGVPAAYVATGVDFPDALTGGVAAARAGGPLLLTEPDRLPPSTHSELVRLAPQQIVVLGGPAAVSDAVVAAMQPLASSGVVVRLAGPDRYATAVAVSSSSFAGPAGAVFVATGRDFPDAMVAVPAAVRSGAPLLLVSTAAVPPSVIAEAQRLGPGRLVLLGGYRVVGERVTFDLRVGLGDLAPLPPCTYDDLPTALREYGDWPRTLLDTTFTVGSEYHPPDLDDVSQAGFGGASGAVRSHVIPDLAALGDAARQAGRPLRIVSAFRSYDTQIATFNHWVAVRGHERALRTSARPGHSEHQLGTAFDFGTPGGPLPWNQRDWGATPAGAWMAANGWRYGFVMSYPPRSFDRVCYDYEPWHYRYVGRHAAALVAASGLTLREWLWLNGSGG